MPFIRQTRDKRGFEHTYVMHTGRSAPARPRVLYLFRSPGNLRVGRRALDSEVREALEHTHPDLNFDWNALSREVVVARAEPPPARPQKGPRQRPQPEAPAQVAPPAVDVPAEDSTLLGRTLGPALAARLRARFSEISQRIVRRARTPEEREALLDRARVLNPDAWPDEASVRAQAVTIDGELDRLSADLPSRRRGRRGGRHRHESSAGAGGSEPSGIMAESDEHHEDSNDPSLDRPPGASDTGRDAGVGPADAAARIPSDD